MRHKSIVLRGLDEDIRTLFYEKKLSQQQIADKLGLKYHEVQRFLRDDKLANFNDDRLEAIAMTDDFTPLNVINYFFQSVHHAFKELAFTGLLAQMLREKLAEKIDQEGIESLNRGDNYELTRQWLNIAAKLAKLTEGSSKHLDGYIQLFDKVLSVQKEVSIVKIVTDVLRQEDPAMFKKIQRALDADPDTKRILELLSREDVIIYWDDKMVATRELLEETE